VNPPRKSRDAYDLLALIANIAIAGGTLVVAVATIAAAWFARGLWSETHLNALPQFDVKANIGSGKSPDTVTIANDGDFAATNISAMCYFRQSQDQPDMNFTPIARRPSEIINRLSKGNGRTLFIGSSCAHTTPETMREGDEVCVFLCYQSVSGETQPPENWIFKVVKIAPGSLWFVDNNGEDDALDKDYFSAMNNSEICPGKVQPPTANPPAP
jgi:hypothetical protein